MVVKTKRDYLTGKIFCDFFIIRNFAVNNQGTIFFGVAGKFVERCSDVGKIFEKIQVFCLDI